MFSGDEIPKERVEYVCIACISIDSVLSVEKKKYPQVCLEQCEYKMKTKYLKKIHWLWSRFWFRLWWWFRWLMMIIDD